MHLHIVHFILTDPMRQMPSLSTFHGQGDEEQGWNDPHRVHIVRGWLTPEPTILPFIQSKMHQLEDAPTHATPKQNHC